EREVTQVGEPPGPNQTGTVSGSAGCAVMIAATPRSGPPFPPGRSRAWPTGQCGCLPPTVWVADTVLTPAACHRDPRGPEHRPGGAARRGRPVVPAVPATRRRADPAQRRAPAPGCPHAGQRPRALAARLGPACSGRTGAGPSGAPPLRGRPTSLGGGRRRPPGDPAFPRAGPATPPPGPVTPRAGPAIVNQKPKAAIPAARVTA